MQIDKKAFAQGIKDRLEKQCGRTLEEATPKQIYFAVSRTTMDYVWDKWIGSRHRRNAEDAKQAYYLSAEFLMGRAMSNNLVNLCMEDSVREVLEELGVDYNLVEDAEPDAGLGNGGLGRLAACFLDSLATHDYPVHGYGIRYRYGMFEQRIEDGQQVEYPDDWLRNGDPWSMERADEEVTVKFGGHVIVQKNEHGAESFKRVDAELITATPYDMPIVGRNSETINYLRLWEATSPDGFNLQLFNDQQYLRAVEKGNRAEDISRVLYPNDSGPLGKELRLRQQYFFSSASLQDIIRRFKARHGTDFTKLPDHAAIQLNDTHPVVAIPELMRILMDWEKLDWEAAWDITSKTFAYTNHTLMAEALEKWPIDTFQNLLPRLYQIIEEANRRFLAMLRERYPRDWERQNRMSIISGGLINMAWLAIIGSKSVNGVAALHTDLLKNEVLNDWYELFPEKFNNKTNGVTQRRWLLKSNPELAAFITERIGDGWIKDFSQIAKLKKYADDAQTLEKLQEIKRKNKEQLAAYIKEKHGHDVNPDSIFDVQVKRLHEYKRQLLNVLHIISLYLKIKEYPEFELQPRTFIFGAKAASGYRRAKLIIKLINNVAEAVNSDPDVSKKMKVFFLENYRVSLAEKIFPASDVSEQISTAGKEASGTGNMKFMMNGALTLGTLDGANIEIVEEAGKENAFIFGLTAEEISQLNAERSYSPWDECEADPDLARVVNTLVDGTFSGGDPDLFRELYDSLMYGLEGNAPDQFYVLKDYAAYRKAQEQVDKAYQDPKSWSRKALLNIASSGKFSSDRTVQQYAQEIWKVTPVRSSSVRSS